MFNPCGLDPERITGWRVVRTFLSFNGRDVLADWLKIWTGFDGVKQCHAFVDGFITGTIFNTYEDADTAVITFQWWWPKAKFFITPYIR